VRQVERPAVNRLAYLPQSHAFDERLRSNNLVGTPEAETFSADLSARGMERVLFVSGAAWQPPPPYISTCRRAARLPSVDRRLPNVYRSTEGGRHMPEVPPQGVNCPLRRTVTKGLAMEDHYSRLITFDYRVTDQLRFCRPEGAAKD